MTDNQPQDTGPARLLELYDNMIQARAIQIAAELGIGDHLAGGPRASGDLAAATSTHPEAMYRLLRLLAGCGVFTEVAPGRFGLTSLGAHLREDHPQSVRAIMVGGGLFARVFADAMHSVRTGAATFPQTYGEPLFTYLRHHPDQGALFNAIMADFSRLQGTAVTDVYDFTGARLIVDVGGGDGALLSAILRACPQTAGVLFDQPEVADAARKQIAAGGLADRCAVVGGDFFHDTPPGGDLYLLKWIIHDWPDPQAADILRTCRRAMSPDGRLLLIEQVVPAGDTPHPSKVMDFSMLVLLQGRERTRDEYGALLARAGFRLTRVVQTSSPVSVIEAVPDG
jgi:SAM-dependent methyltransferase